MPLKDLFLPEFEQECAATRRLLARVPFEQPEFRPHAKSMTLKALASHLVNIPAWVPMTLEQDELDMMPQGVPWKTPQLSTKEEALTAFDQGVAAARSSLEAATDAQLAGIWKLTGNGQTFMESPKQVVLRSFVFNHLVHHRAQLGLYLRLLEIPVPGVYGPSADEPGM